MEYSIVILLTKHIVISLEQSMQERNHHSLKIDMLFLALFALAWSTHWVFSTISAQEPLSRQEKNSQHANLAPKRSDFCSSGACQHDTVQRTTASAIERALRIETAASAGARSDLDAKTDRPTTLVLLNPRRAVNSYCPCTKVLPAHHNEAPRVPPGHRRPARVRRCRHCMQ